MLEYDVVLPVNLSKRLRDSVPPRNATESVATYGYVSLSNYFLPVWIFIYAIHLWLYKLEA